ncbi:4Fe-4S dicluster domain-containing protein [Patescibacteria group bacterium]
MSKKKYNLAVEPGSSKLNKTGSWRTFKPVFNHEKCIGCGNCALVCPEGVCFSTGKKNSKKIIYFEHDDDYCKGCGLCEKECPAKAIDMVRDGG